MRLILMTAGVMLAVGQATAACYYPGPCGDTYGYTNPGDVKNDSKVQDVGAADPVFPLTLAGSGSASACKKATSAVGAENSEGSSASSIFCGLKYSADVRNYFIKGSPKKGPAEPDTKEIYVSGSVQTSVSGGVGWVFAEAEAKVEAGVTVGYTHKFTGNKYTWTATYEPRVDLTTEQQTGDECGSTNALGSQGSCPEDDMPPDL